MANETDHTIKCNRDPFAALWRGDKRYEVRNDDRNFQVGETVRVDEWHEINRKTTGRSAWGTISYKTEGGTWGLPEGLCVLGVSYWRLEDRGASIERLVSDKLREVGGAEREQ